MTGESPYRSIVVALDGSDAAAHAIPHARALAGTAGHVTVVYIRELVPGRSSRQTVPSPAAERIVREQVETMTQQRIDVHLRIAATVSGGAAEAIADIASEVDADVIVIGTRGHSPMTGMLVGSIAQRLPHVAPCPVLVVPPLEKP